MRDNKTYKPYEAPVQTPVDDLAHATEEYIRCKTRVTETSEAVEVAERVLNSARDIHGAMVKQLEVKAEKLRVAAAKVAAGL